MASSDAVSGEVSSQRERLLSSGHTLRRTFSRGVEIGQASCPPLLLLAWTPCPINNRIVRLVFPMDMKQNDTFRFDPYPSHLLDFCSRLRQLLTCLWPRQRLEKLFCVCLQWIIFETVSRANGIFGQPAESSQPVVEPVGVPARGVGLSARSHRATRPQQPHHLAARQFFVIYVQALF